jgi:hypothetical protein
MRVVHVDGPAEDGPFVVSPLVPPTGILVLLPPSARWGGGSAYWPLTANEPLTGPLIDVLVEPAAGMFRDGGGVR